MCTINLSKQRKRPCGDLRHYGKSTRRETAPQARVVIVGGGVMGCGLAYHLGHEGWSDVVLLEKAELTSGSTWHAAGQITHSTSSYGLGKCVGYNIDLYAGQLEKETGLLTWHGCGSFRLAYTMMRWTGCAYDERRDSSWISHGARWSRRDQKTAPFLQS